MGLIKIALPIIAASFALTASTDAVSTSVLETPTSLNNRLRRSLEAVNDMGEEERGFTLKDTTALAPLANAVNGKKAAALARIEKAKIAMINQQLPSVPFSKFTPYFLAGKRTSEIAEALKASGKSKNAIKKEYRAWLKTVLNAME
ncbi:hypothetical protein AM587_10003375 [Phytophthora nicotianae]|uniref:RxLR effector protein n=5 Tax=Phytophthora nicotianae TaxID=4792 RepID=A0A0W8CU85_PHYNI|nr:hypothetical protein F444_23174 [Phytophthora nicotianae P1976]KUF87186.1 hypothetical protein AM587_10003375 [Phytophthora nicotianae]